MFIRLQPTYTFVWIMTILWIIGEIQATKCEFCGKEFVSLGRHTWRCPAKATSVPIAHSINSIAPDCPIVQSMEAKKVATQTPATMNDNTVLCVCGKACKGCKGLTMHRRSCKTAKAIGDSQSTNDVTDTTHPQGGAEGGLLTSDQSINTNLTENPRNNNTLLPTHPLMTSSTRSPHSAVGGVNVDQPYSTPLPSTRLGPGRANSSQSFCPILQGVNYPVKRNGGRRQIFTSK